jgi:hypothetical protein
MQVSDARLRLPHRAHWHSTHYNALHSSINRLFEPIEAQVSVAPAWTHLLAASSWNLHACKFVDRWFIETHQFRIYTAEGIGRPTPEEPIGTALRCLTLSCRYCLIWQGFYLLRSGGTTHWPRRS